MSKLCRVGTVLRSCFPLCISIVVLRQYQIPDNKALCKHIAAERACMISRPSVQVSDTPRVDPNQNQGCSYGYGGNDRHECLEQ